ncbi:hypothetical protein [Komagataeibacter swingsii]|uniref:Uncharacterized protein n=1 Tax=Komagataeibacter swingsii TaxID=215220 RepID=A0A850P6M4_9PROT|nr:hypothetical protein [Komagataeibacter swingsii]NVN36531.1 hypothetical protein [Komagataeibacter swingsii]
MKLFSKSFEERRLFEKRRHPKTFVFHQWIIAHEKRATRRGRPQFQGMQEGPEGIRN